MHLDVSVETDALQNLQPSCGLTHTHTGPRSPVLSAVALTLSVYTLLCLLPVLRPSMVNR